MKPLQPGTALRVSLEFGSSRVFVGRLALDRGVAVFEYAGSFLATSLRLSPLLNASNSLLRAANPRAFDGLHGVFADSLPDAWGELLVRRRAETLGIRYASLSALDTLAIVGSRGFGALVYEPEIGDDVAIERIDLDRLADSALSLVSGEASDALAELERLGGSSGGARPKVLVGLNTSDALIAGDGALPDGFAAWMVKFRSSRHDVEDAGPLEAAYATMARKAGLEVSPTRVIPTRDGRPGYFATQRFDRGARNTRVHVTSSAALLDTQWEVPTIDYGDLLKLTRLVTRNDADVEAIFRRMVFNVIAHNRDDHAKQHAFIMDSRGAWRAAPSYDLTFSRGPGGEHYLAVDGHGGDDISFADIASVADKQGIGHVRVREIVDQVNAAVGGFDAIARDHGLSATTRADVERGLRPL